MPMNDTRILNRVQWLLDQIPASEEITGDEAIQALEDLRKMIEELR